MSSPRGVDHIKRQDVEDYESGKIKTIHTQVYYTADGMKSDECFGSWQPAGWKTRDGRIWFATKKGSVMIDPKVIKRNELPSLVLIERLVVDELTIPVNQFISLTPGREKFEIHYTALSFLIPERVLFKYKLEGFDREWAEAGTRRAAFYTNLAQGNYRFRVIACNDDGVWNKTGASFAFNLQPHFYQTFWFYAIIFILTVGNGFGIYRIRVWQLLKYEKEFKESVDEALAKIKVLDGLIPICANCKKIRDE